MSSGSQAQVAYCSDMDKSVIIANMEKRGWVAVGPDDEWQFYWASTQTCRFKINISTLETETSLDFNYDKPCLVMQ